jgi:protease I
MTDQRPKIAALVADAFQEEEYFFPKIALNEAGYQVEVVSSRKEPVEIYSYFARTGLLDVERAITDARPEDYVGVLIPGGAKSPTLLAEDPRVTKFVQDVSARGGVIACICRGSMLAARSKVVAGRRMTGFNDSVSYPELVVQPDAEAAGASGGRSQSRNFAAPAPFRGFLRGHRGGVASQMTARMLCVAHYLQSYSSWRRHQTPVSLRPLGARSSHWYMPQRPSSPRA